MKNIPFPIKLDRPLCVFDIESTGINPRSDRIIELCIIRLNPDGTDETASWLVNPGVPIPEDSTAIHGITDDLVKFCPPFCDVAQEVRRFIGNSDLSGFSITRFDIPLLVEEFSRAGVFFDASGCRVLDAQRIYHMREPRTLSAALKFYCNIEHTEAHGAEADARATIAVIKGEFEKYPDLPRSIAELDEMLNPRDPFDADRAGRFRWVGEELTVNFGKKKGALVRDIAKDDPGFLYWISKNDFPVDTRRIAEQALKGVYPSPPKPKKAANAEGGEE